METKTYFEFCITNKPISAHPFSTLLTRTGYLKVYFERKTVFPDAALSFAASKISITIRLFSRL